MASNYRAGADLERAAKKVLEENGYFVVKSGGSKGVADLVALKASETLLVQCKNTLSLSRGMMRPAERRAFFGVAGSLRASALVCCWMKEGRAARVPVFGELWSYHDGEFAIVPWSPDHGLAYAQEDARERD